jgi:ubiquinone biosynthesis monooxygenase Coq7
MALPIGSKRSIALATYVSVYEFLAPSLLQLPRASRQIRCLSSTSRSFEAAASNLDQSASSKKSGRSPKSTGEGVSNPTPLNKPLTQTQREFLTSAVSIHTSSLTGPNDLTAFYSSE